MCEAAIEAGGVLITCAMGEVVVSNEKARCVSIKIDGGELHEESISVTVVRRCVTVGDSELVVRGGGTEGGNGCVVTSGGRPSPKDSWIPGGDHSSPRAVSKEVNEVGEVGG